MKSAILPFLCVVVFFLAQCAGKEGKPADGQKKVVDDARMTAGMVVYKQHCLTCHQPDGSGAPPMNPPLVSTSFVLGDPVALVPIVLNGMKGVEVDGVRYKNVMPGFDFLTDQEVADVLTYIRNSFGNNAGEVTPQFVNATRSGDRQ